MSKVKRMRVEPAVMRILREGGKDREKAITAIKKEYGVADLYTYYAASVTYDNQIRKCIKIEEMPDDKTAMQFAAHLFRNEPTLIEFYFENRKNPILSDRIEIRRG